MLTPKYTASTTLTNSAGPMGPANIQGPKGDKGDTGEQGIQGLKGDTGEQGIQGLKGDTGAAGGVALVDFGTTVASSATVTVPCDWVTVDSVIMLAPSTMGTADNDGDEHLYGEFALRAINVVNGAGFDILMESTTKFGFKGTFKINWSVINEGK